MLLLTDGRVIGLSDGDNKTWFMLTPDSTGSYINGTWSTIAAMGTNRLYFGSNVLKDGRVFVVGGEYSGPSLTQNITNTAEIYDPLTDTWSPAATFPQSEFGDDPTILLDDGRVLAGYIFSAATYIYNPATDAWTAGPTKLSGDRSDEESWVYLADGSILSYNIFGNAQHAQRLDPGTNTWIDSGSVPVQLQTSGGAELGPGLLLPDGRVFFVGGTSNTALYTPAAVPATGTWVAGPAIPGGLGANDAPGAVTVNGHVIFVATTTPSFAGPTKIYEFDPTDNSLTDITPAADSNLASIPGYVTRMLCLPTGQVLFSDSSNKPYVYTPAGSPNNAWLPAISGLVNNGTNLTLTGTQLTGLSQGASYGDDANMDTNYPIVRFVDGAGTVFFGRTTNWSTVRVQTGTAPVTTQITMPAGRTNGGYLMSVSANGISSASALAVLLDSAISVATIRMKSGDSTKIQVITSAGTSEFAIAGITAIFANGGSENDTLIVDYNNGPIPLAINYNGCTGTTNGLVVTGTNSQSVTYTPDTATNGSGKVTAPGGTISFQKLSAIDITGLATATLKFPNANESVAMADGFDYISGGTHAAVNLTGTSGGIGFVPVAIWNETTLAIDSTSPSGNDTFTISGANGSAAAANISNLSIKTGSGTDTVSISGTANFQSSVSITSGTISESAAGTINTGTLSMVSGSSLGSSAAPFKFTAANLDADTSANNSNQFFNATGTVAIDATGINAGSGTVQLNGGTFTLATDNTINSSSKLNVNGAIFAIGTKNVSVNTLTLTSGSITGSSGVLTSSQTIQTKSGAVSANLASANGLSQSTSGTTTLSADNTYTGTTTISAGTLALSGVFTNNIIHSGTIDVRSGGTLDCSALSSGKLVVASGQTLKGAGTISGSFTAASGSHIAPGDGPGVMSSGNVTFNSASNFDVEVNGSTVGTLYDQLDVTGTIDLGNSNLNLTLGFTPTVGDTFTLVNNDGIDAITGQFNGFPEGKVFSVTTGLFTGMFRLSYLGGTNHNSVVLTSISNVTILTASGGPLENIDESKPTPPDSFIGKFNDPSNPSGTFNPAQSGAQPTYKVMIDWGDGTAATQVDSFTDGVVYSGTAGIFNVLAPAHTYAEEGTYSFKITVTHDALPPVGPAATSASITVNELQITNLTGGGATQTINEGGTTTAITGLATFTDAAGAEPNTADPTGSSNTHYTTLIHWGDGSTSAGDVVITNATTLRIDAPTHTYNEGGTYTVSVDVTHQSAPTLTVSGAIITVIDLPLTAGALTPPSGLSEGQSVANIPVFQFTDADPSGSATDYTAIVTLGDGNTVTLTSTPSVNGQIVANGSGFDVQLSHTYTTAFSNKTFSVSVTDIGGASTSASTSAFSVADLALTAGSLTPPTGQKIGAAFGPFTVFHFTDAYSGAKASDYVATVVTGEGTLTSAVNPNNVSVVANSGGFDVRLTYTYASALDTRPFSVFVADSGGASASQSGTVTVNGPPGITSNAPPTTAQVGSVYSYTLTAKGTPVPTLSATGLPGWLTLDSSTGVLFGTPAISNEGSTGIITLTAANGMLPDASISFTITVSGPPTISSGAPPGTATAGTTYNYTLIATGTPTPALSASGLPGWLTFDSTTGLLSGTPTIIDKGTTGLITLMATNGIAPNATATFTIAVAGAPAFASAPAASASAAVLDLQGTFIALTDDPAAVITWDFGDGSASQVGGEVSHIYTATGTYTVTSTAIDPLLNLTSTNTFTVTVQPSSQLPDTLPMTVVKGSIKLGSVSDSILMQSVIHIPDGIDVSKTPLSVSIGSINATFTLSKTGSGQAPSKKVKLLYHHKKKSNLTLDQDAKLNVSFKGSGYKSLLSQGVSTDTNGLPKIVTVVVGFGGETLSAVKNVVFKTAHEISTGTFGTKKR